MSPSARAMPMASSGASSSHASRYAAISSGVRKCSATSYGVVLVLGDLLAAALGTVFTPRGQALYSSAFSTTIRCSAAYGLQQSADGKRFLMLKDGAGGDPNATPASMVVVERWFEELKQGVLATGP